MPDRLTLCVCTASCMEGDCVMDTVSCMASNCVAFHTANSIHNSLSLRSCLNVSDQVSHPYKTTGKIIVSVTTLCIDNLSHSKL